jgi:tetratricopeptide (TPR) repeat protein
LADRYANLPGSEAEDPLDHKSAPDRSDRLESWKEIAAYLKRDLSTVQRWEKREGLPVHRHQHDERATVFAYKSEIEAWWHNGRSRLEAGNGGEAKPGTEHGNERSQETGREPEAQSQPLFSRRRRRIWLAGAAVAALAIAAGLFYYLKKPPSPPLNFQSRDLVLITNFDNRTGESVLDGTLEYALGRELTNSQYVSVVPRGRINDTLALMRMPANTRVDAALGRQICLRDGGIRAMITGRIEKFGSTYVLSAELVDPTGGRAVASFEEQASSQAEILPAIHLLSDRLRQSLGEDLTQIRQSDLALQHVTTPSLKALQLYSQADLEISTGSDATAFALFRQAIADDPNFASAYIMAAHALRNQGKPPSEYMPYGKRAVELSTHVSEPERYFIEGSYYGFSGQPDRAVAAYEALLQIDPGNAWATNNLAFSDFARPGHGPEGVDLFARLAKLRPNDPGANWWAGFSAATIAGNGSRARPYLERARALLPTISNRTVVTRVGIWIQLYPAFEAWMKDDVALAAAQLAQAEQNPIERNGEEEPRSFGYFHLALGQSRKANLWFQRVSPGKASFYESDFAALAFARGDQPTLQSSLHSLRGVADRQPLVILLMIHEGLLSEAEAAIRDFRASGLSLNIYARPTARLLEGELLVAEGKTAEGTPMLNEGVRQIRNTVNPFYFFGAELLARAYERQGNTSAALQLLEDVSTGRSLVDGDSAAMNGAYFWMRDQMDLARLYLRLGRVQDAEEIVNELRKLLADADPDFPMLVELKKLHDTSSMASKSN